MLATVFAVLGPTASGKSRLALELAERLPIEIVSVDSGQVYRGMDIGTAKPTPQERQAVPHHLVDLVDPTEAYSAGRFRADAIASATAVLARGRIPLLVGGTMLYYRALAHGIDVLPAADAALRAALAAEAQRKGWSRLHAELTEIDPVTARRVSPGDAQRIQRALEVYRATGRPISAFHRGSRIPPPFTMHAFALLPSDRARLHARIAQRFDTMLADGLIEELHGLRRRYALHAALPSMRCVGYRQTWRYLEGEYGRATLRERAVAATRQLAKRQLTWLRALAEVEPCDADEPTLPARLAERIARGADT